MLLVNDGPGWTRALRLPGARLPAGHDTSRNSVVEGWLAHRCVRLVHGHWPLPVLGAGSGVGSYVQLCASQQCCSCVLAFRSIGGGRGRSLVSDHTVMVRGYICKPPIERLNTTFLRKCSLYANYVPNRPRGGLLRDPNHSLRIDYTLRWFSKLGPSKRVVRPHTSSYLSPIPDNDVRWRSRGARRREAAHQGRRARGGPASLQGTIDD